MGEASHPVRDAWIEINTKCFNKANENVASREGCVD